MRNIVSPLDGFASPFGRADTGLRFLFANSEAGAWYEPSNLSTLFQDAAGTTPVATDADVVGLAVDTSEGGLNSLGPELVTNGAFDTDLSGWTDNSAGSSSISWNASGAMDLVCVGSDVAWAYQAFATEIGKTYKLSYSVIAAGGGNIHVYVGDTTGGGQSYSDLSNVGDYADFFTATATTTYISCREFTAGTSTIDNISIREFPGNHATQSTTSYKPKWYSPNILRFDGVDDRLVTTLKPTTTGSIAMRFKGSTASRVAFGAQPASNGKCYLGLASDGSIAGGIGTQATSIIKGSTDKRGVETTAILTWDGSTVTLYENGVSVYSAAQSGAVDTANAFNFGSLNNAGSSAAHFDGDVSNLIVTDDVITAAEVAKIHSKWSA